MRILITGLLLFLAFGLFGQTVRTVGVVYTASAPVHTPSGQGAWIAVDTTSGSWYEWERTTGVWRDAGYRIQLTNTTGAPSYTPSKARGRVALNSGGSLYAYQAGVWDCLNCVTASDTASYLEQDSILVYYANGVEFDRDTIPFVTLTKILQIVSDSLATLPDSIMSGYGVAGYIPQYFSATKFDTTGLYWNSSVGRFSVGSIFLPFDAEQVPMTLSRGANKSAYIQISPEDSGASKGFFFGYNYNGGTPYNWIVTNSFAQPLRIDATPLILQSGASRKVGIGQVAPTAKAHITGEGTTNLTTALLVENSAGTDMLWIKDDGETIIQSTTAGGDAFKVRTSAGANILYVRGDGVVTLGSSASFGPTNGVFNNFSPSAGTFGFVSPVNWSSGGNNIGYWFFDRGAAATSGNLVDFKIGGIGSTGFNPTSGTATYTELEVRPRFNQTGSASGYVAGIDYNPIATSILGAHYGLLIRSGKVGFGTATPVASARVEISSTTEGLLIPRMTTAQRDAIASPATGLMLFCTDCTATDGSTGVSQTYSSGAWKNHY